MGALPPASFSAARSLMISRIIFRYGTAVSTALFRRITRRVHLYLGLLIWPFVLLFAISGLSFNHPALGRDLTVQRVAADEVKRLTGFSGWNAQRIAENLLQALNVRTPGHLLDSMSSIDFDGWPLFAAPTHAGQRVLIVSLSDGSATLSDRVEAAKEEEAPFAGRFQLEGFDIQELAQRFEPLLAARHEPTTGALRAHPKVHPELRFVLIDAQGKRWNAVYDLSDGTLTGKLRDGASANTLIERLESVHTQHHYPVDRNATTFWALCADITALTLIAWAITGLYMWWQMKNLRKLGLLVIALAITIASSVVLGTMRHLEFSSSTDAER